VTQYRRCKLRQKPLKGNSYGKKKLVAKKPK
jgi:hypothetical protein